MSYNISKSNGTPITVADQTILENYTLPLLGKDISPYGGEIAQSTIRHLENFANTIPPRGAIKGQLWYDTQQEILKVWKGADPLSPNDNTSADRSNEMWTPIGGALIQDLLPEVDNTINIGSPTLRFKNIYAVGFFGTEATLRKCTSSSNRTALTVVGNTSVQGDILPETQSTMPNPCQFITSSSLGSSAKQWDNLYTKKAWINSGGITFTNGSSVIALENGPNNDLFCRGTWIIGGTSYRVTRFFGQDVNTTLLTLGTGTNQGLNSHLMPVIDNTYDLGSTARRYRNMYSVNFVGNASSATNATRAASADKWTFGRTLTLTGNVLGSVVLDGTANVTMNTTVVGLGTAASHDVIAPGVPGNMANKIPVVSTSGVTEIARYLDFHHATNSSTDYDVRLHTDGVNDGALYINGQRIWHTGNLPTVYTQDQVDQKILTAIAATRELVYPIGSVYINATNSANPATYLGFGVWNPYAQGRSIVGNGSTTDANGDSGGYAAGSTGGTYFHKLTVAEMPAHQHIQGFGNNVSQSGRFGSVGGQSARVEDGYGFQSVTTAPLTSSVGGDGKHNNQSPWQCAYVWIRVG
ncbi:baseplate wedge subunit and tail pin [Pseudomonas phage vB_Pa-PAC2]